MDGFNRSGANVDFGALRVCGEPTTNYCKKGAEGGCNLREQFEYRPVLRRRRKRDVVRDTCSFRLTVSGAIRLTDNIKTTSHSKLRWYAYVHQVRFLISRKTMASITTDLADVQISAIRRASNRDELVPNALAFTHHKRAAKSVAPPVTNKTSKLLTIHKFNLINYHGSPSSCGCILQVITNAFDFISLPYEHFCRPSLLISGLHSVCNL